MPSPAQWEAAFCGIDRTRPGSQSERPKHVCLYSEEVRETESQVAFDIDSFLGFADSLAVARQGLLYQPASQMRQNIRADNHLRMISLSDGDDSDGSRRPRSHLTIL